MYLAITVLATVTLYYELYVGASVTTLILPQLGMTFSFYVTALAFGNLLGAFGSLFAGLTDRVGRSNLVVFGLLFTGVFTAFVIPAATSKWPFIIETFVVGIVEGMCLVATPGADPGLLPAGRPGLGHGLLDRRAGARQPGRGRRGQQHRPGGGGQLVLESRVQDLRDRRPGRVRHHVPRPARAVAATARPAHGDACGTGR